jgi:poly-gamma-glutamate synthesis protein (capsule biosynthesis protein)
MKNNKLILKNTIFILIFVIVLNLVIAFIWFLYSKQYSDTSVVSSNNNIIKAEEVNLVAVGDIMLARKVGRLMKEYGSNYPFIHISKKVKQADIAFCNLECPIAEKGEPLPGKGIFFRADPQAAVELKNAGFNLVSLANNHAVDYDSEALNETFYLLKKNNIDWVGAGENIDQALRPKIVNKNGIKIGILGFTDMADIYFSYSYKRTFRAKENISGVAPMIESLMLQEVKKLKDKVDVVVVSIHWGTEYVYQPNIKQINLAHKLIDAGVDLIIGHHPHILQGIEKYKHGLIAYSLGNCIFDQYKSYTKQGLMLDVEFNNLGIKSFKVLPLKINDCQVKIVDDSEKEKILSKLSDLSRKLNNTVFVDKKDSEFQYVLCDR